MSKKIIHIKKTNWLQYQIEIDKIMIREFRNDSDSIELDLNSEYASLINQISQATITSTITTTRKLKEKTLTKYLVDLIKLKKLK